MRCGFAWSFARPVRLRSGVIPPLPCSGGDYTCACLWLQHEPTPGVAPPLRPYPGRACDALRAVPVHATIVHPLTPGLGVVCVRTSVYASVGGR